MGKGLRWRTAKLKNVISYLNPCSPFKMYLYYSMALQSNIHVENLEGWLKQLSYLIFFIHFMPTIVECDAKNVHKVNNICAIMKKKTYLTLSCHTIGLLILQSSHRTLACHTIGFWRSPLDFGVAIGLESSIALWSLIYLSTGLERKTSFI